MVVITEEVVARSELGTLKKQSTLIEPGEIHADYIKHLTSIDGAIYFDVHGACHGIGVILDGIAAPGYGDASRGARFNSAHRYLAKLKSLEEPVPCVIAIISEDGMVNLIPELDNEDKIFELVQEIIDIINKQDKSSEIELSLKEKELQGFEAVDYHLYFKIARAFFRKKIYAKSVEYCELAFRCAGEQHFVLAEYHNLQGDCHYFLDTPEHFEEAIFCYQQAVHLTKKPEELFTYYKNLGYAHNALRNLYAKSDKDKYVNAMNQVIQAINTAEEIAVEHDLGTLSAYCFNIRGLSQDLLGRETAIKDTKRQHRLKAIEDYSKAIELIGDNSVYYWNRALTFQQLSMNKDAIDDFIQAEFLSTDQKYLEAIDDLLKKNHDLWPQAVKFYHEHKEQYDERAELAELIGNYEQSLKEQNQEVPEVAPAKEEP
ncbi:tetratricopeptide repeat protein [Paenibacillus rigui]|uniref:DAC domain-containing protein n=1 Tax=Paenibacillus rigui TaxID=554312 RepID=A0A229UP68_9BACL|nr:hypothetical protein [Paenibacillus rigui]OXM85256.1 hypothetical protein CF651_16810 [Paenibacillus rigui]